MYNLSATDRKTHSFLLNAKSYCSTWRKEILFAKSPSCSAEVNQPFLANLHAMTLSTYQVKPRHVTNVGARIVVRTRYLKTPTCSRSSNIYFSACTGRPYRAIYAVRHARAMPLARQSRCETLPSPQRQAASQERLRVKSRKNPDKPRAVGTPG